MNDFKLITADDLQEMLEATGINEPLKVGQSITIGDHEIVKTATGAMLDGSPVTRVEFIELLKRGRTK